jgi:hypothetical protein
MTLLLDYLHDLNGLHGEFAKRTHFQYSLLFLSPWVLMFLSSVCSTKRTHFLSTINYQLWTINCIYKTNPFQIQDSTNLQSTISNIQFTLCGGILDFACRLAYTDPLEMDMKGKVQ